MPDPGTLALFALAAIALLVVPGPAVLYIVGESIHGGRRAGLISVIGVHVGTLVHVAAAAIGLSALVVSSATAFSVVKYAGAAYLIGLGLVRILGSSGEHHSRRHTPRSRRALVWRGALVNVLNPKTALFFLAFLPQFVDPSAEHVGVQILALGAVFVGLGFVSDGAYALAAGTVATRLRRGDFYARIEHFLSGGTFLTLGAATAISGSRQSW